MSFLCSCVDIFRFSNDFRITVCNIKITWQIKITILRMHVCFCRYQIKVLELLASSKPERYSKNWSGQMKQAMDCEFLKIHAPNGPDLSQNIEYASQAALWGIEVSILTHE